MQNKFMRHDKIYFFRSRKKEKKANQEGNGNPQEN